MVLHVYRKLVVASVILSGFGLQGGAQAQNQPRTPEDFRKIAAERRQQAILESPEFVELIKNSGIQIPADGKADLVRIKNVKSSVMAWWLDPAHNAEPVDFKISTQNEEKFFAPLVDAYSIRQPLGKNYTTPEGASVVALSPQNTVYIVGNDEAIQQLKKNIELLDKSLKQIEIETQYIQISAKNMKRLEIATADEANRSTVKTSGPFKLGFPRADIKTKIAELVKQDKAKVFMSPRVTSINTLTAYIHSAEEVPASMSFKDSTLSFFTGANSSLSATTNTPFKLSVGIGISVRPNVNGDKTLSLFLAPGRTLELKQVSEDKTQEPKSLIIDNLDGVQSIENLEDGETFALLGADTRLVTKVSDKMAQAKLENLLILVTPRIIRRADDQD